MPLKIILLVNQVLMKSSLRNYESIVSLIVIPKISIDIYFWQVIECIERETFFAEVFLAKGFLKKCSKFTGEHHCRSVISIKFLSNIIEITVRQGCSPVNLLYIFRKPFPKNISGGLLLRTFHIYTWCFIVLHIIF